MDNCKYHLLVSAWNVNGLNREKLKDKEFVRNITKYDIVCLTETWTTNERNIKVQGFTEFHNPSPNRLKKKGRNSGGVIVYKRNNVYDGVSCVSSSSNNKI